MVAFQLNLETGTKLLCHLWVVFDAQPGQLRAGAATFPRGLPTSTLPASSGCSW